MANAETLLPLLDLAVGLATEDVELDRQWSERLAALDRRIEQMSEQLAARKSTPPELQDHIREAIDALTLENNLLSDRLSRTTEALARAKAAYREESVYARELEEKLDSLELKVVHALEDDA